ncbi:acetoin dehydrogenase dihydrolipoyllysine-residue acetyltransferase subunit [Meridianimarinicoccus sp. RP-17]|uniref:acetoin dehydrogenase dihydrolipoyllysine-residue acetyltransferase subunit n=1 Tax=Meridianimarinicoccus zhengii TaxID=2056810 RepID=UPI000DAD380B|nr:acetoin dehydrogenase dihydrolipoyllysine-residue acetyltransferase subunit [Phycocomes zhengii]
MTTGTLKMPRLGETMDQGQIASWLVAEGDSFARGDPLIEVETDKTVVEYPALGPGVLTERLVAEGDTVPVGAPIARVDTGDGPDWTVEGDDTPSAVAPEPDAPEPVTQVTDLLMPRLGETMETGDIAAWLIQPGDSFARGDAILEVETDKTVAEVPALVAGTLVEILAEAGQTVTVGAPIARIETGEAVDTPAPVPAKSDPAVAAPAKPIPARPAAGADGTPLRATPVARRLARRAGVALSALTGTGRRGRIEARDVTAAAASPAGLRVTQGIACAETGPADGTPVLLLHGFAGDHTTFAGLSHALGRAGCRVVAADLPGHGATVAGADDPDTLAAAMLPFARTLPRGVHVVAHSLGALPAVRMAEAGLAASLTLIAPAGLGSHIDAGFIDGLAAAQSPGSVGHLLRRMTDGPNGLSDDAVAQIHATLAQGRLRGLAAALHGPGGQSVNLVPALARLADRMPVRIVVGHRDRVVDWRDALAVSPMVAVHHVPQAGHMPHWEAPLEVRALILKAVGAT